MEYNSYLKASASKYAFDIVGDIHCGPVLFSPWDIIAIYDEHYGSLNIILVHARP